MPGTIYTDIQTPETKSRSMGEAIQIGVLSLIIVVFLAISASSAVGLLVSAMHH